jgi:predicted naringenin-chalcone synthase
MPLAILGLGTAVPPTSFSQAEGLGVAIGTSPPKSGQETFLPGIYRSSGINTRHVCLDRQVVDDLIQGTKVSGSCFLPTGKPEERGPSTQERMAIYHQEAPKIAIRSASEALARSGKKASDITHLVTVSCTGFSAPGFDLALVNQLGLSSGVSRTHVGFMGCHGSFNGLRVTKAYAEADPKACVLMCSSELCSLHYYYGLEPSQLIANALFADGSGAIVGVQASAATNELNGWQVVANGSKVLADSTKLMTWDVGNHGFEMTLSKKIPILIGQTLRTWLVDWLADHQLQLQDVRSWAIHPGGPRILDAIQTSLELPLDALQNSWDILGEYGNMSSATILFILNRLAEKKVDGPCVALGFGPGMNIEAMLLKRSR